MLFYTMLFLIVRKMSVLIGNEVIRSEAAFLNKQLLR